MHVNRIKLPRGPRELRYVRSRGRIVIALHNAAQPETAARNSLELPEDDLPALLDVVNALKREIATAAAA